MKCTLLLLLPLSITASARYSYPRALRNLQLRQSQECCFQLESNGPVNGTVGELSDGQVRVGPVYNESTTFCIQNGEIMDGDGRGCILTPPTTQFQCDTGATPTAGFCVDNNGYLEYNGSDIFYACPVDDNGNYNIYSQPVANQTKCVVISLSSVNDTCAGSCSADNTTSSSVLPLSTMFSNTSTATTTMLSTTTSTDSTTVTSTTTDLETTTATVNQTTTIVSPTTIYATATATATATTTIVSSASCSGSGSGGPGCTVTVAPTSSFSPPPTPPPPPPPPPPPATTSSTPPPPPAPPPPSSSTPPPSGPPPTSKSACATTTVSGQTAAACSGTSTVTAASAASAAAIAIAR